LEIPAERAPEYEFSYAVEGSGVELSAFNALIDATSCSSVSSSSTSGTDAWTEPSARVCEHVNNFDMHTKIADLVDSDTCSKCDLKNNLWKCLSCGVLCCGRRQFDGSGGNGHAMEHFTDTQHSLALKLGTVSVRADGLEADIYCYKCDDMVLDPSLTDHLLRLGIDPGEARKTEQSLAELNVHINLTHSYAMTDSSGSELKTLSGPWLRGFANLGNSCYLAAVVQSLRNLDREAFLAAKHEYLQCPSAKASTCFACQLKKLYKGLSKEAEASQSLSPWMFKRVAAGSNAEFQSGRQQDALEFLTHLLQNCYKRATCVSACAQDFSLELEETLACGVCGSETHRVSQESCLILSTPDGLDQCSLSELLQTRFSSESVEWKCDDCATSKTIDVSSCKRTKIVGLPNYLVIVVNRLKMKNWVPEKTECHIEGMQDDLCLNQFCGEKTHVTQVTQMASNNDCNAQSSKTTADPVLLGELLLMGMEENSARAALIQCNNSSIDAAMTIIFEGPKDSLPNGESVNTLMAAGFSETRALEALQATNGDLERAFDWIFSHPQEATNAGFNASNAICSFDSVDFNSKYQLNSFITHKGSSLFCGHYVCHLRDESLGKWILFNDDKVAEAAIDQSFPIKDAYIYIYKKKGNCN
jgi:ubiquitin carboxyl-terminal hydrolase 5/13